MTDDDREGSNGSHDETARGARLADRDVARLRASVADVDDELDAHFELVREAGSGGMGVVYEAIERATNRQVAVKVMTGFGGPNERARFAAEAEVLERLDHPAIVDYVCHGMTARAEPYLAMEWLVGESLSARLERGPLALVDAVMVGERIADALAHAHAEGVVHRDLKPSNIFLVENLPAEAHLIDFGVAKRTDRDMTATGQMIGTPGYMAPEQARGERTVGASADLFALGCVLYKALSGKDAFTGAEVMEVLARLLLEDPTPIDTVLPDTPPRLVRLINALLAKQPLDRLGSASLACTELREIRIALIAGDDSTLGRRSPNVPVPTPARRRSWQVAAAGAGLMIVAVVAIGLVILARAPASKPSNQDAPVVAACTDAQRGGCKAACETNSGPACYLLARTLHANTVGIPVDHEAARIADTKACRLGILEGCVGAGSSLLDVAKRYPDGDPRRGPWLADAEKMLVKACDANIGEGCRRLGRAVSKGFGPMPPDPPRAFALVRKGCDLDDVTACAALRDMVTDPNNGATDALRADGRKTRAAACARKLPDLPCDP